MAIDYVQWGRNMIAAGHADTFGKWMYWQRYIKGVSLKDLRKLLDYTYTVSQLSKIEKDEEVVVFMERMEVKPIETIQQEIQDCLENLPDSEV